MALDATLRALAAALCMANSRCSCKHRALAVWQRACADFLVMLGMQAAIDGAVRHAECFGFLAQCFVGLTQCPMLITRASQSLF